MKLEWNVYTHNINSDKIEIYNIFEHGGFSKDVKADIKKCKTKEEFAQKLRSNLFYYFGSKCEWEIVLTSWTTRIKMDELDRLNMEREKALREYGRQPSSLLVNPSVSKKIDVYSQVRLNFDVFLDYVWSRKGGN